MSVSSIEQQATRAMRIAQQCFALARSTSFEGERDAAIAKGVAVAEKAGLSLDRFDIPGRVRKVRQSTSTTTNRPGIGERMRSDGDWREAVREAADTRRRWAEELRAADDETIYDARRRHFDTATAEAADRDRAAGRRTTAAPDREALRRAGLSDRWPSIDAAVNALRARRVNVRPIENAAPPAWSVTAGGSPQLDEWQLRELADEVCQR